MTFDWSDLVSVPPTTRDGKPGHFYIFYQQLKSHTNVNGLWLHLVHQHRHEEIEHTGALWEDYWTNYSDGGKCGNINHAGL